MKRRVRVPNWDIQLLKWAQSVTGQPFSWGTTDCASLIRAAHRVMYGRDVFARRVKSYKSKKAALRVLAETGGVEVVLRAMGAEELPIAFAQQGDVVIEPATDQEGLQVAGIVVDGYMLTADPDDNVFRHPLHQCLDDAFVLRLPHG